MNKSAVPADAPQSILKMATTTTRTNDNKNTTSNKTQSKHIFISTKPSFVIFYVK